MTVDPNSWNPFQALTDLAGKAIDAKAARYGAGAFDADDPRYGVDENGRAFTRGAPTGTIAGVDQRLVLLGAGVLAVALVVYLAKS